MIRVLFAVLLTGLGAAALFAQELNCDAPQTQVEMTGCAARSYESADAELNRVYALALAVARRMDEGQSWEPSTAEMLRDAQRAWIPFRDAACASESTVMRGGTGQNHVFYICLDRLTRQRTGDLQIFAELN